MCEVVVRVEDGTQKRTKDQDLSGEVSNVKRRKVVDTVFVFFVQRGVDLQLERFWQSVVPVLQLLTRLSSSLDEIFERV